MQEPITFWGITVERSGARTIALSGVVLLCIVFYLAFSDSQYTAPDLMSMLVILVSKVIGLVSLLPVYGLPLIVSMLLAICMKNAFPQFVLSATSLLYGGWFAYQMYNVFYVLPTDAQNGLIVVFVGIYFLPIALPLWGLAAIVEICKRKKDAAKV